MTLKTIAFLLAMIFRSVCSLWQPNRLVTTALFLEYEVVLKCPEQREAHGLGVGDVDHLLNELAAILEPVDVRLTWRPQLTDPADELVLEAAVQTASGLRSVVLPRSLRAEAISFPSPR